MLSLSEMQQKTFIEHLFIENEINSFCFFAFKVGLNGQMDSIWNENAGCSGMNSNCASLKGESKLQSLSRNNK